MWHHSKSIQSNAIGLNQPDRKPWFPTPVARRPPNVPISVRNLGTVAVFLVACFCACSQPSLPEGVAKSRTGSASKPEAEEALTASEHVMLKLDIPPLSWGKATASVGGQKLALVVAANSYADKNWDIPFAVPSANELRTMLLRDFGFTTVEFLSGDRVYADNVKAKIAELTGKVRGQNNLLFVHWIGHGFNIDGLQRLLTYHSKHDGETYTATLPYERLTSWLAATKKRVRVGGGQLRVALVVDACRVRGLAAPAKITNHVPTIDVEAFSAELGRPAQAQAGASRSAFTGAMCDYLSRMRGRKVSLLETLKAASIVCASQNPQITTGDSDMFLAGPNDMSLTIVPVSNTTRTLVPGAVVELNGVRRNGEAVFRGLALTSEGYHLRIGAPGYFWRTLTVQVAQERAGWRVQVPLLPEFVLLTGHVVGSGSQSNIVRVHVVGDLGSASIEGYHRIATQRQGPGYVALRIPRLKGSRVLRVEVNGTFVMQRPFNLAELPTKLMQVKGVSVPVVDLGVLATEERSQPSFADGTSNQSANLSQIAFDTDIHVNFSALGESHFVDARSWNLYKKSVEIASVVTVRRTHLFIC